MGDAIMETIRARTDVEGAVIYLECSDDTPVGLVKVKTDHYVIARRTRETMRSALVEKVAKGANVTDALDDTRKKLVSGMKALTHVSGCREKHTEWSDFAYAFVESWA